MLPRRRRGSPRSQRVLLAEGQLHAQLTRNTRDRGVHLALELGFVVGDGNGVGDLLRKRRRDLV
ncbi:MAG: hypothetical protein JXR84_08005 [Anaerolineae bacterium]|nr:hypothetical protein [Anaerolineae bacterium]